MNANRYDAGALEGWTAEVFAACGVPERDATLAASLLVRSELRGYKTHGLTRVPAYAQRLQSREMNPRPSIEHRRFPGGIVVDADGAMGHVAGPYAIRLAMQELVETASVLVAIQDCGHLGALGIHALLAAEAGAFCMLGQRTPPLLALPGFTRAAIGHNPLAFGCPVPRSTPIVFDVACSVAARGHILLAAREGKPIPDGWALDEHGQATTDASRALRGMLVPMGGHKGIGLAMMVECLAGALAATPDGHAKDRNAVPEGGAAGGQGAFLWLVKPSTFVDETVFGQYMEQWTATYLEAGADGARLPGARGDRLEREGRESGIELTPTMEQELRSVGARLRIPLPA